MIAQLLTPSHVATLVVALLLLFAPRRQPQTGRAPGRILHQFVDATAGEDAAPDVKRAAPPPDAAHGERAAGAERHAGPPPRDVGDVGRGLRYQRFWQAAAPRPTRG